MYNFQHFDLIHGIISAYTSVLVANLPQTLIATPKSLQVHQQKLESELHFVLFFYAFLCWNSKRGVMLLTSLTVNLYKIPKYLFKYEFTLCQDMTLAPVMTPSFKIKLIFLPHLERK